MSLSGVARPSAYLKGLMSCLHTPGGTRTLQSVVEDAKMVDGLAIAMEQALASATASDGRVDMKVAAMHLLQTMRENQR